MRRSGIFEDALSNPLLGHPRPSVQAARVRVIPENPGAEGRLVKDDISDQFAKILAHAFEDKSPSYKQGLWHLTQLSFAAAIARAYYPYGSKIADRFQLGEGAAYVFNVCGAVANSFMILRLLGDSVIVLFPKSRYASLPENAARFLQIQGNSPITVSALILGSLVCHTSIFVYEYNTVGKIEALFGLSEAPLFLASVVRGWQVVANVCQRQSSGLSQQDNGIDYNQIRKYFWKVAQGNLRLAVQKFAQLSMTNPHDEKVIEILRLIEALRENTNGVDNKTNMTQLLQQLCILLPPVEKQESSTALACRIQKKTQTNESQGLFEVMKKHSDEILVGSVMAGLTGFTGNPFFLSSLYSNKIETNWAKILFQVTAPISSGVLYWLLVNIGYNNGVTIANLFKTIYTDGFKKWCNDNLFSPLANSLSERGLNIVLLLLVATIQCLAFAPTLEGAIEFMSNPKASHREFETLFGTVTWSISWIPLKALCWIIISGMAIYNWFPAKSTADGVYKIASNIYYYMIYLFNKLGWCKDEGVERFNAINKLNRLLGILDPSLQGKFDSVSAQTLTVIVLLLYLMSLVPNKALLGRIFSTNEGNVADLVSLLCMNLPKEVQDSLTQPVTSLMNRETDLTQALSSSVERGDRQSSQNNKSRGCCGFFSSKPTARTSKPVESILYPNNHVSEINSSQSRGCLSWFFNCLSSGSEDASENAEQNKPLPRRLNTLPGDDDYQAYVDIEDGALASGT